MRKKPITLNNLFPCTTITIHIPRDLTEILESQAQKQKVTLTQLCALYIERAAEIVSGGKDE